MQANGRVRDHVPGQSSGHLNGTLPEVRCRTCIWSIRALSLRRTTRSMPVTSRSSSTRRVRRWPQAHLPGAEARRHADERVVLDELHGRRRHHPRRAQLGAPGPSGTTMLARIRMILTGRSSRLRRRRRSSQYRAIRAPRRRMLDASAQARTKGSWIVPSRSAACMREAARLHVPYALPAFGRAPDFRALGPAFLRAGLRQ